MGSGLHAPAGRGHVVAHRIRNARAFPVALTVVFILSDFLKMNIQEKLDTHVERSIPGTESWESLHSDHLASSTVGD